MLIAEWDPLFAKTQRPGVSSKTLNQQARWCSQMGLQAHHSSPHSAKIHQIVISSIVVDRLLCMLKL
jgi:hypothetical protein